MSRWRAIDARDLPDRPLDAWAMAAERIVPLVRAQLQPNVGHDVVLVLDAADHTHTNWREALVQELAREAAPLRVNAIASAPDVDLSQTFAFLDKTPGITGQILHVDDNSGQES